MEVVSILHDGNDVDLQQVQITTAAETATAAIATISLLTNWDVCLVGLTAEMNDDGVDGGGWPTLGPSLWVCVCV